MTRQILSALIVVLPLAGSHPAAAPRVAPQARPIDIAPQVEVFSTERDGSPHLAVRLRGANLPAVLLNFGVDKVVAVKACPADGRYVVIGNTGASDVIDIVDLRKPRHIKVFNGRNASVSPDGAIVSFLEHYAAGDPAARVAYVAVPTSPASDADLQPTVIYPKGAGPHFTLSSLQWVRPNVLAFLDHANGTTSLVAFELRADASVGRFVKYDLPADQLLEPDYEAVGGKSRALAIARPIIRELPSRGLDVRLSFPGSQGIRIRRLDITLW